MRRLVAASLAASLAVALVIAWMTRVQFFIVRTVAPARRWPPCGLTGTRSSDIALAGEEPVAMSSGQLVGRVDDLPSGKVTRVGRYPVGNADGDGLRR